MALSLIGACTPEEEPLPSGTDVSGQIEPAETQSPLLTAPTRAPQTIAAMMFDISGGPPNATTVAGFISGTGNSQRHMYQEISFGIQDLQPTISGPYTLPVANCLTIACCGPSSDKTGNGATVQQIISGLPATYNHYFYVYGTIPSGANCGTWGDEGAPTKYATYSSYSFQGLVGYAQELGHNFGMTHEPTMTCAGSATFLDDPTQCTHVEYGNTLSFMGGGSHHPSAFHKYMQGWIGGCNVVKAGASGTFQLVPQELPCNGVQLLQIPAPKVRAAPAAGDRQGTAPMLSHYYLEMRAPVGFDAGLGPMVLVSIGPDFGPTNRAAPYVYLLDLTPETGRANLTNAGLRTVGQSYMDPAGGLTFTLTAISNTSATVTVTSTAGTGAATCVDGTAFTAPGPDGTSCGPLAGGGAADGGTVTGTGGASGSAGAGGSAGRGGAGGATGAGGITTVTTGTGGNTATGAGGTATTGAGGAGGGSTTGSGAKDSATGGCSCTAAPGRAGSGWLLALSLALAGCVARRRSRR
jgi:hypothetical protein